MLFHRHNALLTRLVMIVQKISNGQSNERCARDQ